MSVPIKLATKPCVKVHECVKANFGYEFNFRDNSPQFVLPRHIAMYLTRQIAPWASFPMIGRYYGGRDHSTVMYAVRKIGQQRIGNPALEQLLSELTAALRVEQPRPSDILRQELLRSAMERTGTFNESREAIA